MRPAAPPCAPFARTTYEQSVAGSVWGRAPTSSRGCKVTPRGPSRMGVRRPVAPPRDVFSFGDAPPVTRAGDVSAVNVAPAIDGALAIHPFAIEVDRDGA